MTHALGITAAHDDQAFLLRALRLASCSLGQTAPNPGVGCVIVRGGSILGRGRHERCGAAHAEVAALADCRARGHDPAGATAYVTLAPCTRIGRQPACTTALRQARIARVVAAIADPAQADPAHAGLRAAGIAYALADADSDAARLATQLHGGFLCRIRHGRPRCTGKWAMTLDGHLATRSGDSRWISSPQALALSRRRRRHFDAIVIGAGTARSDDPALLAPQPRAHAHGVGPRRIVLGGAPLPVSARLREDDASSGRSAPWLQICADGNVIGSAALREEAARAEPGRLDPHDARAVAAFLGRLGCNDVLIEGGAVVHAAWLTADLYDRLELYTGFATLAGGRPVSDGTGSPRLNDATRWRPETPPRVLGDCVLLRMERLAT